jgi:hypothetical protein
MGRNHLLSFNEIAFPSFRQIQIETIQASKPIEFIADTK